MKLSEAQWNIAQDPKRMRVAICGRRFGKTVLAIRELCKAGSKPRQKCWYVAPTYKQARQVVFQELKDRLNDLRWLAKVNETNLEFVLKNGSTIALKGADNFDSLRGVGLNFLVLDEFADIKPEAWYSTLRPTLSDKQGRALFIGTPRGIGNWSYDIFNTAQSNPDTWSSYQYTTLDGKRVPAQELEFAREDLDEKTFRQEYEATFETYSGVIYYNFDRNIHVQQYSGEIPTTIHVGLDFNIDPMSASIGVQTPDGFHFIDHLQIYGSNTTEVIEELKHRYPQQKIFVYPDASGRQRRSSANGMTDHILLQNAGFVVKTANINPAVKDRIAAVNSRLKNSAGQVGLWIDPKCKPIIEGLERQTYKEGTHIPDKDGKTDHQNDATGYVISWLYPIRRDNINTEPGNWRSRQGNRL
jgi:hypothetical protein